MKYRVDKPQYGFSIDFHRGAYYDIVTAMRLANLRSAIFNDLRPQNVYDLHEFLISIC